MQVYQALKKNNIVFPGGEIRNDKTRDYIQVDGNLNDINKVANLIIGYYNGSPVYLRDVALIYKGITKKKYFTFYQPSLKYSDYNTGIFKDAIFIGVAKRKGTNAVFVVNDLKKKLDEIQKELPKGYQIVEVQNE
jgi:multidrug efflux pump subunit AcrB